MEPASIGTPTPIPPHVITPPRSHTPRILQGWHLAFLIFSVVTAVASIVAILVGWFARPHRNERTAVHPFSDSLWPRLRQITAPLSDPPPPRHPDEIAAADVFSHPHFTRSRTPPPAPPASAAAPLSLTQPGPAAAATPGHAAPPLPPDATNSCSPSLSPPHRRGPLPPDAADSNHPVASFSDPNTSLSKHNRDTDADTAPSTALYSGAFTDIQTTDRIADTSADAQHRRSDHIDPAADRPASPTGPNAPPRVIVGAAGTIPASRLLASSPSLRDITTSRRCTAGTGAADDDDSEVVGEVYGYTYGGAAATRPHSGRGGAAAAAGGAAVAWAGTDAGGGTDGGTDANSSDAVRAAAGGTRLGSPAPSHRIGSVPHSSGALSRDSSVRPARATPPPPLDASFGLGRVAGLYGDGSGDVIGSGRSWARWGGAGDDAASGAARGPHAGEVDHVPDGVGDDAAAAAAALGGGRSAVSGRVCDDAAFAAFSRETSTTATSVGLQTSVAVTASDSTTTEGSAQPVPRAPVGGGLGGASAPGGPDRVVRGAAAGGFVPADGSAAGAASAPTGAHTGDPPMDVSVTASPRRQRAAGDDASFAGAGSSGRPSGDANGAHRSPGALGPAGADEAAAGNMTVRATEDARAGTPTAPGGTPSTATITVGPMAIGGPASLLAGPDRNRRVGRALIASAMAATTPVIPAARPSDCGTASSGSPASPHSAFGDAPTPLSTLSALMAPPAPRRPAAVPAASAAATEAAAAAAAAATAVAAAAAAAPDITSPRASSSSDSDPPDPFPYAGVHSATPSQAGSFSLSPPRSRRGGSRHASPSRPAARPADGSAGGSVVGALRSMGSGGLSALSGGGLLASGGSRGGSGASWDQPTAAAAAIEARAGGPLRYDARSMDAITTPPWAAAGALSSSTSLSPRGGGAGRPGGSRPGSAAASFSLAAGRLGAGALASASFASHPPTEAAPAATTAGTGGAATATLVAATATASFPSRYRLVQADARAAPSRGGAMTGALGAVAAVPFVRSPPQSPPRTPPAALGGPRTLRGAWGAHTPAGTVGGEDPAVGSASGADGGATPVGHDGDAATAAPPAGGAVTADADFSDDAVGRDVGGRDAARPTVARDMSIPTAPGRGPDAVPSDAAEEPTRPQPPATDRHPRADVGGGGGGDSTAADAMASGARHSVAGAPAGPSDASSGAPPAASGAADVDPSAPAAAVNEDGGTVAGAGPLEAPPAAPHGDALPTQAPARPDVSVAPPPARRATQPIVANINLLSSQSTLSRGSSVSMRHPDGGQPLPAEQAAQREVGAPGSDDGTGSGAPPVGAAEREHLPATAADATTAAASRRGSEVDDVGTA